jgi:hypothetical protein
MIIELTTIKKYVEQNLNCQLNVKKRTRESAYARSLYYRLARDYTISPLSEIGKLVNRDHATVLHGLKLYEEAAAYSNIIDKAYNVFSRGIKLYNNEGIKKRVDDIDNLIDENKKLKQKVFDLNIKLGTKQDEPKFDTKTIKGQIHNLIETVEDTEKLEVLYMRLTAITKML